MQDIIIRNRILSEHVGILSSESPYTFMHMTRTAEYAERCFDYFEEIMGISKMEFLIATFLHDIGKALITHYLNTKTTLNGEDYQEMRRHPIIGHYLLVPVYGDDHPISIAAKEHHERVDGHGYPYGMVGNTIQPYSQVIGWLDKFDAITHQRPYRTNWIKPEQAFEKLNGIEGEKIFSTDITNIFTEIKKDKVLENIAQI